MAEIAKSAQDMISGMSPELRQGAFVFVSSQDPGLTSRLIPDALASFREEEGLSLIVAVDAAALEGLAVDQPMRCITLNVYSSLEGVGLTAAVSAALGEHGIACNMVAACHHDHVFVPEDRAAEALQVLEELQRSGRAG